MYSIIFCGTPEFACPSLQALNDDPVFVVASVITQPDRPVGRKHQITSPPVKGLADELNIPVIQPEDINTLSPPEERPDFLVVVAYGQIFSKELLAIPTIAPVNVHASLLPHLRGASPVQHSILQGDTETGITIQRMAETLDTGPILAQEIVRIDPRETSISLTDRLSAISARLLLNTLKKPLKETPQDEGKATSCGKLTRLMGEVNPATMTAEEIDRRINDIEGTTEQLFQCKGMMVLRTFCPSTGKRFSLSVGDECRTCSEAVDWLWDMPGTDKLIVGRT